MPRPKMFLNRKAHALIDSCHTVGFLDEDWLTRNYGDTPCLRWHNKGDSNESRVCGEKIQFVSGRHPPDYFLSLTDPKGKPLPDTLWSPALTRPHHFLNGWAATVLEDAQHEKVGQEAAKTRLQLYRHRCPNGRVFEEMVQFETADDYFLTLKNDEGQLLGGSVWERNRLHQGHELASTAMKMLAGSSWAEHARKYGAHLCAYVLPDGRQYREFLQLSGSSDEYPIYFLGLHEVGAQGEAVDVVQDTIFKGL